MGLSAKLWRSDGVSNDRFGDTVAMSGNQILVGAPEAFISGSSAFDDLGTATGEGIASFFTVSNGSTRFDFDGDSNADISVSSVGILANGGICVPRMVKMERLLSERSTDVAVPADFHR